MFLTGIREKIKHAALITLLICGVAFAIGGVLAIVGFALHSENFWLLLAVPLWMFLSFLAGDFWTEL